MSPDLARDHDHAHGATATTTHEDARSPGHDSRSAHLAAPANPVASGIVGGSLHDSIASSYGVDLSGVRMHTDTDAAGKADALDARAFAQGDDVYFGEGEYAPGSRAGDHLIAHELAHVAQTRGGSGAGIQRKSHGADTAAAEVEADRAADVAIANIYDGGSTQIRLGGVTGGVFRKARAASAATSNRASGAKIDIHAAIKVMDAIACIINDYVASDGTRIGDLSEHADVPAEYQPLLREWWTIAHGRVRGPGGIVIDISGALLPSHIERAMAMTRPIVDELMGDEAKVAPTYLINEYYARIGQLKAKAAKDEFHESIEAGARSKMGVGADFESMNEREQVRSGAKEAVKAAAATSNALEQMAHTEHEMQEKLAEIWRKRFPESAPGALREAHGMTPLAGIKHVTGILEAISAVCEISDPEEREKIFHKHESSLGKVGQASQILNLCTELLKGGTAVLGIGTFAVASALGKAEVATRVLGATSKALETMGNVVNVLGLVHGTCVLLDPHASMEAKVEAGFEVGSSGLGVAGTLIPAIAAPAAAASLSVTVNFFAIKSIVDEGMGMYTEMIAQGLDRAYRRMQGDAQRLSETSLRLATALELATHATDPLRRQAAVGEVEELRIRTTSLARSFISDALSPGNESHPGSYDPLRERFEPLASANLDTDAGLFATVGSIVRIVVSCVQDHEKILEETAVSYMKKFG